MNTNATPDPEFTARALIAMRDDLKTAVDGLEQSRRTLNAIFDHYGIEPVTVEAEVDPIDPHVRREYRVRLALRRRELRLERTPAKHWSRKHFDPGYQILEGNRVIAGCCQREYEMTLDEVEAYVARMPS